MRWLLVVLTLACASPARADHPTVVVELYTSQGCSSCPPADELLSHLDQELEGIEVIPLAFHVDYWDYIGWRDPFSNKTWSDRQRRYGRKFAEGRIYTPQLVVGGERHVVGSNRRDVTAAIRKSARRLAPVKARISERSVERLQVRASGPKGANLYLVVHESDINTRVARGENAGRKLHNDFVVRAMTRISNGIGMVRLSRRWKPNKLEAVVIAQDPDSLRIIGARRIKLR
jgi:hypothetical protein